MGRSRLDELTSLRFFSTMVCRMFGFIGSSVARVSRIGEGKRISDRLSACVKVKLSF